MGFDVGTLWLRRRELLVGCGEGRGVGSGLGTGVGAGDGWAVGYRVGTDIGTGLGTRVGAGDGAVSCAVGSGVGTAVGTRVSGDIVYTPEPWFARRLTFVHDAGPVQDFRKGQRFVRPFLTVNK